MAQPFTLLLVHHSHTDVGYTEVQHRIERWHVDFIRQALAILEVRPDFRWVCETWWAVERFLGAASPGEVEVFAEHVRARRIGLSASYLNFSELVDAPVLRAVTARAGRAAAAWDAEVRCALTADVNGFGAGFAPALLDAGATDLFTCVHTHHGMYPLGRTQLPFRWEAPDERHVLVWNGEHYHMGNELGLVPGANSSYLIKDECDAATIFGDHRKVATLRIPRYVEALRERDYPYEFAPVMASGLRTDNGPPNVAVLDAVEWWNETHATATGIEVRMAVLEDVFDAVRAANVEVPVYAGDWPDWWSDGPASRPRAVRLFRQTQRDFADVAAVGEAERTQIETDLALFAEHTWSHSDAMSTPWHELVHTIDVLKEGHLARACAAVGALRDAASERRGGAPLRPGMPLGFHVANAATETVSDVARLGVGHYEFEELGLGRGFAVRDLDTGGDLPCQLVHVPRGGEILVPLTLEPGAVRRLAIRPAANGRGGSAAARAGDALATDHVRVAWHATSGIDQLVDARTERDLLRRGAPHAPFQPIHDVTPLDDVADVCGVRGRMGLNRKGADAIVSTGELDGVPQVHEGEVIRSATLPYDLPGTRFCELELDLHVHAARLDARLRFHKESLWAPENVYAALPFAAGEDAVTWLDKAGAILRPRLDQLPGTLTDYYAVQSGWASVTQDFGVVVLMPDQHLLQLGPLAHGERLLAGDSRLATDPAYAHGWLMTNFWETNFTADLGGFHEFRYTLLWGAELADPIGALARGRATLRGFETVRFAEDSR